VQDANDLWNATYFCGSCATLRRAALDQIGGIAQETVTEDAHTSLRLQKAGWNTAYINIPQAAGLATETLVRHIKQRIRWARGMVQILRLDNPLFARGLTLSQRLCYFNATLHFLYALPRLIFLTAPLLYLLFGLSNVPGYWLAILAFAGPHLVLSTIANSRIQRSKRFSFWNEIYETVLSPYILLPTLLAAVSPKIGTFNVTDKGGAHEQGYFNRRLSTPFFILLGLNLAGLALAIPRISTGSRTLRNHLGECVLGFAQRDDPGRGSLGLRGTAATETCGPDSLQSSDHSSRRRVWWWKEPRLTYPPAAWARRCSARGDGRPGRDRISRRRRYDGTIARAVLTSGHAAAWRIQFAPMSLGEQKLLTRVLYSRADRWLDWDEGLAPDNPLRSFFSVLRSSVAGYWKLLFMNPGSASDSPGQAIEPCTCRGHHRAGAGDPGLGLLARQRCSRARPQRSCSGAYRIVVHAGLPLAREGNVPVGTARQQGSTQVRHSAKLAGAGRRAPPEISNS